MEREAGTWTCSDLNMTVCIVGVSGATAGPPATDSAALLKDIVSQCMWRSLETHAALCKCEVGQAIYFLPKSVWSDIAWPPRQQMLGPFHRDFQTHLIMFPLISGKTPLRAPKVPGSCVSHSEMSASTCWNKAEAEAYLQSWADLASRAEQALCSKTHLRLKHPILFKQKVSVGSYTTLTRYRTFSVLLGIKTCKSFLIGYSCNSEKSVTPTMQPL